MDPMEGFDICLVFTLPPSDSTLRGTKDAYTSEITFLVKILGIGKSTFVNQALSCLQGEPLRNTLTVSLMNERIKNE